MRKHPNSHREANATAPVLDSTRDFTTVILSWCTPWTCQPARHGWLEPNRRRRIGEIQVIDLAFEARIVEN